jgi:hypothetical protein
MGGGWFWRAPAARSCLICEVIVRRQDQEHCASITRMIRHYVARRAKVTESHPHNAAMRYVGLRAQLGCLAVRSAYRGLCWPIMGGVSGQRCG